MIKGGYEYGKYVKRNIYLGFSITRGGGLVQSAYVGMLVQHHGIDPVFTWVQVGRVTSLRLYASTF